MLKECLDIFQSMKQKSERDLIIDTHVPADGVYVLVKETKEGFIPGNPAVIRYDKKKKEWLGKTHEDYAVLKLYDYYSRLIEMNKPMDPKKIIHGNNYLSFVIKQESLLNGKLTEEIIDGYYHMLFAPENKYEKGKANQIYEDAKRSVGEVDVKKAEAIRDWVKRHVFQPEVLGIVPEKKGYLKLFFQTGTKEEAELRLKNEANRYLIPNIYNSNEYNTMVEDTIYGVPNNYLANLAAEGTYNVYMDSDRGRIRAYGDNELPDNSLSGIYLRLKRDKEIVIWQVDHVCSYRPRLNKTFYYQNVIPVDITKEKELSPAYGPIETKKAMQQVVNEVLFSNMILRNYFTEGKDIPVKDGELKRCILESRDALFQWFGKGTEGSCVQILKKMSLRLIKNSLGNGYFKRACHQFNFRISLMDWETKGEKQMAKKIEELKQSLRIKLNAKETMDFSNDEEYYFAAGQAIMFLIDKSKTGKKTCALANPFFDSKTNRQMKEKLRQTYRKYNYDITLPGVRVQNLLAMIMAYDAEEEMNQDLLLAGFFTNSLIFEKAKEEK